MRTVAYTAACVVALAGVFACGSSNRDAERASDSARAAGDAARAAGDAASKNAENMQKGAQDMARGFEAMAKGLAAAAGNGTSGDTKPVDPVSFKQLQTVMPDVSGWEKVNPTGERMTTPFSYSQASVTYRKGDAEVDEKVMDSGFNQLLFAPFSMLMATGYEKETQDGYERSVTVEGNPGWEKWDKGSRNGELSVVVDKRFLVQLEGHRVDDVKDLQAILDKTDLKALASMK